MVAHLVRLDDKVVSPFGLIIAYLSETANKLGDASRSLHYLLRATTCRVFLWKLIVG